MGRIRTRTTATRTKGKNPLSDAAAIRRLKLVGEYRDVFEGIPDMGNVFYGLADYLSLWIDRHGFRMNDIEFGQVGWRNDNILTFRVTRRPSRSAISPCRYDTRLPEHPLALAYRPKRIKAFLAKAYTFRRVMRRVDDHVRDWAWTWNVNLSKLQVAARWAGSGHVVLKMIPEWAAASPRRYMSHYRYEA